MKKSLLALALPASLLFAPVQAQDLEITVTNLTHGIYFTPIIAAAHTDQISMFTVGTPASPELQAMAEGGDIAGLSGVLSGAGADLAENPAGGLLAPATSTTFSLTNQEGNDYLSIVSMLLPTNDAFMGLNSWRIPEAAGTYTVYVNAYDAGTEVNDELLVDGGGAPGVPGMPAAPGGDAGSNGVGVTTTETNTNVHIHRGSLGDDDPNGGPSDVDNRIHRWLNPIIRVTVVVR